MYNNNCKIYRQMQFDIIDIKREHELILFF